MPVEESCPGPPASCARRSAAPPCPPAAGRVGADAAPAAVGHVAPARRRRVRRRRDPLALHRPVRRRLVEIRAAVVPRADHVEDAAARAGRRDIQRPIELHGALDQEDQDPAHDPVPRLRRDARARADGHRRVLRHPDGLAGRGQIGVAHRSAQRERIARHRGDARTPTGPPDLPSGRSVSCRPTSGRGSRPTARAGRDRRLRSPSHRPGRLRSLRPRRRRPARRTR